VTTIDNEVVTVALDGSGNLTIDDNSTAGIADNAVLAIVSTNLRITDADNVLVTSVGTQVSDHEVLVPLATITSQQVIANLRAGNDQLNAAGVSATLRLEAAGGPGDDTLTGSSQADTLSGDTGDDSLLGGGGDDLLAGGLGDDDLDGGAGTDLLTITQNGHLAITTTQTFGQGTDTFANIEGALIEAGAANNRLDASQATIPVTLLGQGGNDTLLGGSAADSLDGGAGTDFAAVFGNNIVLTNGTAPESTDTLTSVERLLLKASVRGSSIDASRYTLGPVTIVGSGGDDTLTGSPAGDFILAGGGKDSIDGGGGADLIYGGSGRDTINGDGGNDTILGGRGRDEIDGSADSDFLRGGGGSDTIRGGDGTDRVFGGGGRDFVDGDDGNDTLFGGGGRDDIAGGLGVDQLNGDVRDDTFSQQVGQDLLIGGQRPQARRVSPRSAKEPELAFSSKPPIASEEERGIDDFFGTPLLIELLEL